MQAIFIGVDVSRDTLDIACWPSKDVMTIANSRREIHQWLKTVASQACLAMESTGAYHQALAELARQAGLRVYVLNPRQVWHAARGEGRRSKTDRVDAQVIAKFLHDQIQRLHEWCPGTSLQAEVESLQRRRHCIERHCTAMRMSMSQLCGLDADIERFEKAARALQQAIDVRVQLLVELDQDMAHKSERLRTVPAIGPVGAATLAALFARVPFARSDSVVAFAGVDVRASDSGTYRGRRHLTKQGPAYLRRQIWLIGFAAYHMKIYATLREALAARGLAFTEIAMILGRRILRIAWAVWRTDQPFNSALVARRA